MRKFAIAAIAMLVGASPVIAQVNMQYNGQYSGQYSGQSNGQYSGRVDGRASHKEGLPPSAADRDNLTHENPIASSDCKEAAQVNPSYRPGWTDRVDRFCNQ
jgi:hypothetical protein